MPEPAHLVILSGGLDSVTLAHRARAEYPDARIGAVTFDYGQRHGQRERACARACAQRLDMFAHEVTIPRNLWGPEATSALLDHHANMPDGHYAEDTMRQTIVPNRNALMLTMAATTLAAIGGGRLWFGAHAGDHYVYPDCRPAFLDALSTALAAGNEPTPIEITAPYIRATKADIVADGHRLGVPFADTWSCYRGLTRHCGRCGTCVERAEAFHLAGIPDPTPYADPDYWRAAVTAHEEPAT